MHDVTVIGAGVIGTFIARELSKYNLDILLLDKDTDVANGTTKANSAIVHAGYDCKPGTLKAKLNAKGNQMFEDICSDLDVHFKRTGSFVVAFEEEQLPTLKELYERGIENKIPEIQLINGSEVLKKDPNLSTDIRGALYAPTCGIVGPFELAIALAENAVENGVKLQLETEVRDIKKSDQGFVINTNQGTVRSKYIINAAGVYADQVNSMVAESLFDIKPRKGQYYLLDKSAGKLVNHVVFQCPSDKGKGVLVLPTVHGNLLIGPDSETLDSRDDVDTTVESLDYIYETAKQTCPDIPFNKVITTFAGLRATPSTGDFIIEESKTMKGFINVAGIESPGLASSPAIAEYVVDILKSVSGDLKPNSSFNPKRREMVRFHELTSEEKANVIKEDKRYGRIVCRCEYITEGEIVDAIHRNVGARTVDGIKRRVRPGMGLCQGGFCGPQVVEIIARELKMDITEVEKDKKGSYLLTGMTKA